MTSNPREELLEIFQTAIAAVAPGPAILRYLSIAGDEIRIAGHSFKIPQQGLYVIGGGKGAAPMAQTLENLLGSRIKEGLIVVKYDHGLELDKIKIMEAAHPVPDEAGQLGAEACLQIAKKCRNGDLLICLLTGGASALLPAPAHGLSLADLQKLTSLLLASGAAIEEINAIRKHLSSLSGGRLVQAANGAQILTLIISDVLGDDPASIASGLSSPDPYTYADCLKIIEKYQLESKVPSKVMELLLAGVDGKIPETPKETDQIFKNVENVIIASNHQALEAAAKQSEAFGFDTRILPQAMEGEASAYAEKLLKMAQEIQTSLSPDSRPVCLLAGGECTVSLSGSGKGGRNQEMALAAAIALTGKDGIDCLFAGTDGTDGPTDAAGGFANGQTSAEMGGYEQAKAYLQNHDSYAALKKAGAHLITGPTRTNVMDLAIILIRPKA